MRRFLPAVVAAAVVLITLVPAGGQGQYGTVLIGTWEGEIQMARGQNTPDRTLIIDSVGEGEGPVAVKGRFGTTAQNLGRMEGSLETAGGQAVLRFKTPAGFPVVLQLHGEKDLVGTIAFSGVGVRLQENPMRLKKKGP